MAKKRVATDSDIRKLTIPKLKVAIQHLCERGLVAFIWGPPGVGKSEIVEQIGRDTGRPVIDIRLLLMDPTDVKGIPYFDPSTNTMRWARPNEFPASDDPELSNAIIFLDELNAAPPAVQASAYQLLLNRKVGEYELPPDTWLVAAGNRETDRGVTYRMPSPLKSRVVHFEIQFSFPAWQEWAITDGHIHPDVIGYLSHKEEHADQFDPTSANRAYACPRTWTFVSKALDDNLDKEIEEAIIAGCVGAGIATEFAAARNQASKLPKPDDILSGKVTRINTTEISAMYTLVASLCYKMSQVKDKYANPKSYPEEERFTEKEYYSIVNNFFSFMMKNLKPEMIVFGAKTAISNYKIKIKHTEIECWDEFYSKYRKYIFVNKND